MSFSQANSRGRLLQFLEENYGKINRNIRVQRNVVNGLYNILKKDIDFKILYEQNDNIKILFLKFIL